MGDTDICDSLKNIFLMLTKFLLVSSSKNYRSFQKWHLTRISIWFSIISVISDGEFPDSFDVTNRTNQDWHDSCSFLSRFIFILNYRHFKVKILTRFKITRVFLFIFDDDFAIIATSIDIHWLLFTAFG